VAEPDALSGSDALNLLPFADVPPGEGWRLLVIVPPSMPALYEALKRDAEGLDWVTVIFDRRSAVRQEPGGDEERRTFGPADDQLLLRGWTQVWIPPRSTSARPSSD
jgi:hypothetical protein